jgi:hypothetical protein
MAIPLEDAIALATEPVEASAVISMHDDLGVVLVGGATLTFRPDLPLLNWGTGTIAGGGASRVTNWFKYRGQVPGFSSRGEPGTNQLEWKGANQPLLSFEFLRATRSGLRILWPVWLGSQHPNRDRVARRSGRGDSGNPTQRESGWNAPPRHGPHPLANGGQPSLLYRRAGRHSHFRSPGVAGVARRPPANLPACHHRA